MEDKCVTEKNMGCSHECKFSISFLAFTCSCPEGMELGRDMKNCQGPGTSIGAAGVGEWGRELVSHFTSCAWAVPVIVPKLRPVNLFTVGYRAR